MSKHNNIYPISALSLDKLIPLSNNPFELYEGQRLDDLVESIQVNGVLVPIIVRPVNNESYEILAGHNRVEASKILGLDAIPSIVRDDLTDVEAMFVAIETNLIQRSFSDFSYSERAATIAVHYEGIKDQGRRTDLVAEVEAMLNIDSGEQPLTFRPVGEKLRAVKLTGNEYGLSGRNVSRYLRINRLIPKFKKRLNTGAISLRCAVSLSYLSTDEQELVNEVLTTSGHRLSMIEAEELRKAKKPLTYNTAYQIVEDETARATAPFKLQQIVISKYFKPEQSRDEIEEIITKALNMYFNR